jgi:hypothetical protein
VLSVFATYNKDFHLINQSENSSKPPLFGFVSAADSLCVFYSVSQPGSSECGAWWQEERSAETFIRRGPKEHKVRRGTGQSRGPSGVKDDVLYSLKISYSGVGISADDTFMTKVMYV